MKKRRWGRRVGVGLGVVALGLVVAYQILARDIEPPDDTHILIEYSEVADADNAYMALLATTGLYVRVEMADGNRAMGACTDMMSGAIPWDNTVAANLLARNAIFLAAIENASHLPQYQAPVFTNTAVNIPFLQDALHAAKLWRVESSIAMRAGDLELAAESCHKINRLGHQMLSSPSFLIEALVGIAIRGIALTQYLELARNGASVKQVQRWRDRDGGWLPMYDSLVAAYKGEYIFNKLMMKDHARQFSSTYIEYGGPVGYLLDRLLTSRLAFQPHRTQTMAADRYDFLCQQARLPPWQRSDSISNDWDGSPLKLLRPNGVGHAFVQMISSHLDSCANSWDLTDLMASNIETMAALHAYRRDSGELPDSLAQLMPDYLTAIPTDLFDGEPMKYNRDRGLFYSVGKNLTDEGGSYDAEFTRLVSHIKSDDLVFLIDPPVKDFESESSRSRRSARSRRRIRRTRD